MSFDNVEIIQFTLLRLWGRTAITPDRVSIFMRTDFRSYTRDCVFCALCEMDSCRAVFKPAGKWMEVILDVFPCSDPLLRANNVLSISSCESCEILELWVLSSLSTCLY